MHIYDIMYMYIHIWECTHIYGICTFVYVIE
jgi:hypothetical protein